MDPGNDGDLLRGIAGGDLGALRDFVDLYQGRVRGLCSRLLSHPQDAEDVAQDVFFQVYRSAGAFRHDSSVSTWVYRIAVNRCRNFNRDNRKRKLDGRTLGIAGGPAAPSSDDPASAISLNETRAVIRNAVDTLPEKQRTMLILNKFEGRSYQEIAGILGVSLGSVESCLFRAKKNLQKSLTAAFPNLRLGRKSGSDPVSKGMPNENERS